MRGIRFRTDFNRYFFSSRRTVSVLPQKMERFTGVEGGRQKMETSWEYFRANVGHITTHYTLYRYNLEPRTLMWKKSSSNISLNHKVQAFSFLRISIPHRLTSCHHILHQSIFFCKTSVGKKCRDGSNTLLFTDKQQDHLFRFVAMI